LVCYYFAPGTGCEILQCLSVSLSANTFKKPVVRISPKFRDRGLVSSRDITILFSGVVDVVMFARRGLGQGNANTSYCQSDSPGRKWHHFRGEVAVYDRVVLFVHVTLICVEGERDATAVDSNTAVEQELRLREDVRQSQSCQENRGQPDVRSCRNSIHINYSQFAHTDPAK